MNKRTWRRVVILAACAGVLGGECGCESVRSLVAIPFDMAAHMAMETAKLPYETAKIGAQGIVDVVAAAMR